jgi:hypothetical protein
VIESYYLTLEECIRNCPLSVTYQLSLIHLSPSTAYIEGEILFLKGFKLFIFEFLRSRVDRIEREKYRYQCLSEDGMPIFRYDNAPHHQEVKTFPHHKHFEKKVLESSNPGLAQVIEEIEEIILL